MAGDHLAGLGKGTRLGQCGWNLQGIAGHPVEFLLGNGDAIDLHDGFAGKTVAGSVAEEDEPNKEKDQHNNHEAGVFADIFNHGRSICGAE